MTQERNSDDRGKGGITDGSGSQKEELEPFEKVHDLEDPDGTIVVIDQIKTPLSEFPADPHLDLESAPLSALDINRPLGYDNPDEPVVVGVYEGVLDAHFDGWRDWDKHELSHKVLNTIPEDSGISRVDIYPYARSRVERYDAANYHEKDGGTIVCNTCEDEFNVIDEWVAHRVTECDPIEPNSQ